MGNFLYFCQLFKTYLILILSLEQFSLFSVVQFPNDECTSSSSTTTLGTCLASSECANRAGAAAGSCAAGFGVCCVVSVSTCGDTVSSNITYIRNPGYPGTYTPTSSGSCSFTVYKASDDICQLRKGFNINNNILYLLNKRDPAWSGSFTMPRLVYI